MPYRPPLTHGGVLVDGSHGEEAQSLRLPVKDLPPNWRAWPPAPVTRAIGGECATARRSLILAVPSAIIPEEVNFLLNPAHPDFRRVKIPKPVPFHFDPRLVGR